MADSPERKSYLEQLYLVLVTVGERIDYRTITNKNISLHYHLHGTHVLLNFNDLRLRTHSSIGKMVSMGCC